MATEHPPLSVGTKPIAACLGPRGWQWLGQHCQPSNGGCDLLLSPVQQVIWRECVGAGAHAHVATRRQEARTSQVHVGGLVGWRLPPAWSDVCIARRIPQISKGPQSGVILERVQNTIAKPGPSSTRDFCASYPFPPVFAAEVCRNENLRKTLRSSLHQACPWGIPPSTSRSQAR